MDKNEAVKEGVFDAFFAILHDGMFPIPREMMMDAIARGVQAAVAEAICEGRWRSPGESA